MAWSECVLCDTKFKSEVTSVNHDKKLHMTPGPGRDISFKYDYCSEENFNRSEPIYHILKNHKNCTICAKVCPTQNLFENHMKAIHHKASQKYTFERKPSLKKYKNKMYS